MVKQYFGSLNNIHVRMYIILFFLVSACSLTHSNDVMIVKRSSYSGTLSFPSYDLTIQKLYYHNNKHIASVNYALNGWQIIDSSIFNYKDRGVYRVEFTPQYNDLSKNIERYVYSDSSYSSNIDSFGLFDKLNDKYKLSKDYIEDLLELLNMQPKAYTKGYLFEDGVLPLLFLQYGIPKDELLTSFSFEIANNLIQNDCFEYDNYLLYRTYDYDENVMLRSVTIKVLAKKNDSELEFKEYFFPLSDSIR